MLHCEVEGEKVLVFLVFNSFSHFTFLMMPSARQESAGGKLQLLQRSCNLQDNPQCGTRF